MLAAAPGTIIVYGDIACPWATLAVARLHRVRAELGIDDHVRLDHRAFPLELINRRPTPKPVLDAEIPVVGALEPGFGFQMWSSPEWTWPVTVLGALGAVQAAKAQGLGVSERLDLALRRAMFADSRCIATRTVLLEVAQGCDGLDVDALTAAIDTDSRAGDVVAQCEEAPRVGVKGSPHLFLPDGSDHHNPGVRLHWEGEPGAGGFPVVDHDDPTVYADLLRAAVQLQRQR
jgi:predicted DsbA family dithiol-disulfide isomerase